MGLADGEEWVLRPCVEGMCLYESLIDGTLSLKDVARMNDVLDVKYENQARQRKASE